MIKFLHNLATHSPNLTVEAEPVLLSIFRAYIILLYERSLTKIFAMKQLSTPSGS